MNTLSDLTPFVAVDGMRNHSHPEIAAHYRLNFEPVTFVDAKGQTGSQLMHERRREKTHIDHQGDYLTALARPTFFH